jgi:signal transduction histidine kinase
LFFVYFVLISILGVATFFFGYIGSKGNRRRQLFNLFWSSLLGYSLGGLNYFIVFNVPPAFFGVLGNLGIIFHMVVYAYTITKQRLMDISVVISRAVAEILAVVFHGTIYLLLVWLYHTNVSAAIDWPFLVGTVLYGILVGQTHQNLRLFFQTTSDKLFLKGKYDYYKSLADASSRVGEKLSLEHILQVLYDTFSNVVEIANPQVYLPENFAESEASKNYMVYRKTTYQPDKNAGVIDFTSELAKKLTVSRQPLYDVKELNAAMVIPCLVEERLIGFFALGPKLSEEHYTYEDIHLLETLASQAAIALDHTRSYEKIRVELETAERQLERSQRLASIGTLIAGVTHEIRNPLTVIRAETERLINQPRDIDYLKNYQELLIKHITRIEGIVQRMLGMAKEKPKREAEININDQIEQVLSIYKADSVATVFKLDGITIRPELAKEKLMIKGDPEEIQEVFVNLVQNAIEAMGQGGTLTIKTYQQGGRPVAEITDTGKGISPELKEKIFDPFFSTRHEGVGLGLSIAYRIVREHGGDIQVSSEVGKGTTFKVLF